jgi:hypothetical protein
MTNTDVGSYNNTAVTGWRSSYQEKLSAAPACYLKPQGLGVLINMHKKKVITSHT